MAEIATAQSYNNLVITDFSHQIIINSTFGVNDHSFPCYFSDSLFLNDIKDTISLYVKEKFGVNTIIFPSEAFPSCELILFPKKIKPKPPVEINKNDLSMSILTRINFRKIELQEVFYQISSSIYIVDGKGKKKFKQSIKIPFMVKPSDGIMTDTLIHKIDFEIIYLDALSASFKKGSELLEKRFIYQPLTELYHSILDYSLDYFIERTDTSYALGKVDAPSVPVLSLKVQQEEVNDTVVALYSKLMQYQVVHLNRLDTNNILFGANNNGQVEIKISGGIIEGDFIFDRDGKLSGKVQNDSVDIHWNSISNVSEIRINNVLLGIIHYKDDGSHLYYKIGNSPNALAEISFLVFLYEEAGFIMQESTETMPQYEEIYDVIDLLF
jgi:hypothetical protein